MNLVLIDADSIIYIVAYNLRELKRSDFGDCVLVEQSVDSVLSALFLNTGATHYVGAFSAPTNFRQTLYKFAPYKGNRGTKHEYIVEWEGYIKEYLINSYGFVTIPDMEADDVVSIGKELYPNAIIASPDKDLRQTAGAYFDYSKNTPIEYLTEEQAERNFYMSMLTGDTVDNIKGIVGMGTVKATKLLEKCDTDLEMDAVVREAYETAYGTHYGPIIWDEHYRTLSLLTTKHRNYYWIDAPYESLIKDVPSYSTLIEDQSI